MSLRQVTRTTARSLSVLRRVSHAHAARALHSLSEHRVDVLPRTQRPPRRSFATPPPQYHQYSDATMDKMLESLENLLDELADPEYEVEYGSGVLTLKLGSKGTYVINKQPPNKQIWLSSPFSGPKRYDYAPEQDEWVYYRDGRSLSDLLNQELSDALGRKVDLGLTDVSTQLS
ncbi:Frataxin [Lentinus brumalis]|uniref:ferroxidase n=1 Tax=Lentinus brumalis TaxID=2498619 RepID=A0A371DU49_9APHY|nr:Frataxin [Polyporus brumalis]